MGTPGNSTLSRSSDTTAQTGISGVPKVRTPLDVACYQQVPCESVTHVYIGCNGAAINPDARSEAPSAPACTWHAGGDYQPEINFSFVAKAGWNP